MKYEVEINMPIENHEVPDIRELVGWGRRDKDFPAIFERCNFWAGVRDENHKLIAFGYVTGMALEHGYMEDIMVHLRRSISKSINPRVRTIRFRNCDSYI